MFQCEVKHDVKCCKSAKLKKCSLSVEKNVKNDTYDTLYVRVFGPIFKLKHFPPTGQILFLVHTLELVQTN